MLTYAQLLAGVTPDGCHATCRLPSLALQSTEVCATAALLTLLTLLLTLLLTTCRLPSLALPSAEVCARDQHCCTADFTTDFTTDNLPHPLADASVQQGRCESRHILLFDFVKFFYFLPFFYFFRLFRQAESAVRLDASLVT